MGLPAEIQKIFDDTDAQTVRWHRLCRQIAEGTDAAGGLARRAQGEPKNDTNVAMMLLNLTAFAALQQELINIIGNKT